MAVINIAFMILAMWRIVKKELEVYESCDKARSRNGGPEGLGKSKGWSEVQTDCNLEFSQDRWVHR